MGKNHGSTQCRNTTKTVMVHLDKYDKFRDLGKEAPAPAGHEKIRVH